ncbi:hypothetical protein BJV74DRAFT_798813 [Russula compacta]|nr:hypothetical protein BJV74DRAFT_798813 [Russula compacta]
MTRTNQEVVVLPYVEGWVPLRTAFSLAAGFLPVSTDPKTQTENKYSSIAVESRKEAHNPDDWTMVWGGQGPEFPSSRRWRFGLGIWISKMTKIKQKRTPIQRLEEVVEMRIAASEQAGSRNAARYDRSPTQARGISRSDKDWNTKLYNLQLLYSVWSNRVFPRRKGTTVLTTSKCHFGSFGGAMNAWDRLPGTGMEVPRHFSANSQSEDEDFSVDVTSSGWDAWKSAIDVLRRVALDVLARSDVLMCSGTLIEGYLGDKDNDDPAVCARNEARQMEQMRAQTSRNATCDVYGKKWEGGENPYELEGQ